MIHHGRNIADAELCSIKTNFLNVSKEPKELLCIVFCYFIVQYSFICMESNLLVHFFFMFII